MDKKVIYPIFSECAKFTLDPYWKQLFEECARGKFPRFCGVDSDCKAIYFRNKVTNATTASYKLSGGPEQIFQDLKMLFQTQLNFKSKQDHQDVRDELDTICKELQESYTGTWKTIKRKKIRDPIIRRFILNLKESYNLGDKETAAVAQMIKLGFLFNWISNEQVEYEDRQILNINILHYNQETGEFELEEPSTVYKREYKNKVPRLSTLWDKHLKTPKNKYLL